MFNALRILVLFLIFFWSQAIGNHHPETSFFDQCQGSAVRSIDYSESDKLPRDCTAWVRNKPKALCTDRDKMMEYFAHYYTSVYDRGDTSAEDLVKMFKAAGCFKTVPVITRIDEQSKYPFYSNVVEIFNPTGDSAKVSIRLFSVLGQYFGEDPPQTYYFGQAFVDLAEEETSL